MTSSLYDQDFYAWTAEQAALLRSGKLSTADIENIAEEIESMGKGERRELESRLVVLLLHLLKWRFQPERRGRSWQATIRVQRRDLARHLRLNPSLASKVDDAVDYAYGNAVIEAGAETSLAEDVFPEACPWSFGQIMDGGFWPE
jgi:ribosomal protein L29